MKCEKREALRIKVELSGNIDEYARSFLAIYNNVKSDPYLLKMYNDYSNNVYVVCEKNVEKAAVEFLEQFGEIKSVVTVEVIQPIVYDWNYRDDIDTEFLAVEEM